MKKSKLPLVLLLACASPALFAEDAYRSVPLDRLHIAGEGLSEHIFSGGWRWGALVPDDIVTEGSGDAVIVEINGNPGASSAGRRVIFKVIDGAAISGKVRLANPENRNETGQIERSYTFSSGEGAPATAEEFNAAKARYYDGLLGSDIPGEGWFRYQRDHYNAALKKPVTGRAEFQRLRSSRDDAWLALFTGDSAIRDNLQLDRPLRITSGAAERTVKLDSLAGVTVKEFDWIKVMQSGVFALDPLAACIPEDQHVVFFPGFDAMLGLLDEADRRGSPLLAAAMPRAGDMRTRERYRRQLCLDVTELGRLAGPLLVNGIAFTGSDPYLPMGSDVGVVFDAKQPELLAAFFRAKHALAAKDGAEARRGEFSGVAWSGVVNTDRTVSAFVAVRGAKVFVSNSTVQLARLLATDAGAAPALAKLPEYKFFRQRYAPGEAGESAFVYVSDATIRRWCGPRWRILAARRAEAAAALGTAASASVADPKSPAPVSPEHGSPAFMTPLAELSCDWVTPAEASAYTVWRDGYQRGWRQFFDPIAIRLSISDKKYAADMTVMPLILENDYARMLSIARGGEIRADACDPRPDALLQYAFAIDPNAREVRQLEGLFNGSRGGEESPLDKLKPRPLAWLGTSLALRLDPDPVIAELAALAEKHGEDSPEFGKAMSEKWAKLPVSLWIDSRDQASLAFFMTALRGLVNSSAPGVVTWETSEQSGKPYVTVSGPQGAQIHYHVGKKALFVTLSESVMKSYLERLDAPPVAAGAATPAWLGKHACLKFDGAMLGLLDGVTRDSYRTRVRRASWSALPVLNELRRAAPDKDPVALYEKLWGVALTCPAGGRYVWNAEHGSMESTVTGSPVNPKDFRPASALLPGIGSGDFGLTFEHDGVRARFDLIRKTDTDGAR